MIQKILWALLAVLVVLQFIRPAKNISSDTSKDITKVYTIPADVQEILKVSCYDCHSNNTAYKWYHNIQPLGWWLNHHIEDGKAELNFSEFATYPFKKQLHKIEEIGDVVDNNEMPLESYTLVHKEARLTDEQKQKLIDWSVSLLPNN